MSHLILLGDSILDNAAYVPGGPSVTQHLRRALGRSWRITMLARDGAMVQDVADQRTQLPADATHLIVSAGGNDALGCSSIVRQEPAASIADALTRLEDVRDGFAAEYRAMLRELVASNKPMAICTVYDSVPGLERFERAALSLFNDVILREAFAAKVPVIDLRLICNEAEDYAKSSPIEPSASGGGKIARAIARLLLTEDLTDAGSVVVGRF